MLEYTPSRVLVTGGCGFIGSNFVNYVFEEWSQSTIIVLDKLILNSNVGYLDETVRQSSRFVMITGDIGNRPLVVDLLEKHQVDTVVHFAADCTSTRCYRDPLEAVDNNLFAFINFLESVTVYGRVLRFVHISTDEVYGESELCTNSKGKMETAILAPTNPYAATKSACESFALAYHRQSRRLTGLIVLRINNIYGANQWAVKLIPNFVNVAIIGERFPVQGQGNQLRSWLHVDDAARGVQVAVEKGISGQVYNLGTHDELSVLNVAKAVQKEVDKQLGRPEKVPQFVTIPDRPYNDKRYLIDSAKACVHLGWVPKIIFQEGLRRMVESSLEKPKLSQKMNVVIYGGNGWIGRQFQHLLDDNDIPFQLAECRVGRHTDEQVLAELRHLSPSHVFCCTGRTHGGGINTIEYLEGGPDKTCENVRDNLYCPLFLARVCHQTGIHFTYLGTAYLFKYDDEHPIGGRGFSDSDSPTYFGNSYSVVKGFTDRTIGQYGALGGRCAHAICILCEAFRRLQGSKEC